MARLLALIAISVLSVVAPYGQQAQSTATLTRTEQMIPMRDGVRLHTQIYKPVRASGPLPIVFQRTPYGVGQNTAEIVASALVDLPADGYIIVLQDIRGRFKSEGSFVMLRQPRPAKASGGDGAKAIDRGVWPGESLSWRLAR